MNKVAPWSFSKIKAFEQCPKQFYHEKILKEYPFVETDAMLYGTAFHLAAEEHIRDNKPLPKKFDFAQGMLDSLKNKRGLKICERKMGLTEDLYPCDFFSNDVWFRGIADLIIINTPENLAWVIDYKTGKNAKYAAEKRNGYPSMNVCALPRKKISGTLNRADYVKDIVL